MNNPDFYPFEENRLRYCFGEFTLDLANGFLRRGEQELVLRPKPFEVLVYLVQHHGKVVSKTALIEAVWPDVFVSDNSLAQCMVEIRRALDDDSQQIIRTVARRGYIFATPVASPVIEIPSRQPWMPADAGNPAHIAGRRRLNLRIAGALALVLMVLAGLISVWLTRSSKLDLRYAKITNFTDSAMAPALSADGRMIAFFRSDNWFLTRDEAHIKLLPNGEPVQLTHDPRLKCCLAFSPDGSRVAYTTLENTVGWRTYTVPSLGGEPTLLLSNAAAVSWLDSRRILFSEVRTGIHMAIVTALEDRSEYREIYFPAHQRAMAHFSSPSPDRKWILVIEMGPDGGWEPCRLIPFDGTSAGRQAGPQGQCIAAAWSPNGRWMYFSATVEGKHHLWRQRFPSGKPELITSSSTEEDGVAVTPDGRSLITSVGIRQGVLWIHDTAGERPLTKEGDVAPERAWPTPAALFSPDGESIYHLMRRDSPESAMARK